MVANKTGWQTDRQMDGQMKVQTEDGHTDRLTVGRQMYRQIDVANILMINRSAIT